MNVVGSQLCILDQTKHIKLVQSLCRSFENNLTTYRLLSHRTADSDLPNVSSLIILNRTITSLRGLKLKILFIYFLTSDSVDYSVRFFLIRCIVIL